MQTTTKHPMNDLRERAAAVTSPTDDGIVSARQAAAILSGICRLVAMRFGVDAMQCACADLAQLTPMDFSLLPTAYDGRMPEQLSLIASVARSVRQIAGEETLRAALSFWATENDPAVLSQIAA